MGEGKRLVELMSNDEKVFNVKSKAGGMKAASEVGIDVED